MTRQSILALAVSALVLSAAASAYSPFRSWKTITTEHFRIHYAEEQAELAQTAARLAERVHGELAPALEWTPSEATDVVIADDTDFANGSASPLPFNQIHLIVTPPEAGQSIEVTDEEDWLYLLIKHEYAHILHLDAASGVPAALRKVFGRQLPLFPSVLQPGWGIEGLATDIEGDAARGTGRGHASDLPMRMRAEVLKGVKPLRQASLVNPTEWPRGYVSYLYGQHFYQFVRERYGETAWKRFIVNYRRNLIPFRIHSNARAATGKNMDALWTEFQRWLEERYGRQIDAIRAQGVVEGEQLTRGGTLDYNSSLAVDAGGAAYYVRSPHTRETAALIRRDADGREQVLTQVHGQARFDVHPRAGIVLAQPEFCDSERFYFDLYRIEPGATRPRRITRCARYRQVAWHPDGESFFGLRVENGISRIDRLGPDGGVIGTVWTSSPGERASQLTVSPAGKRLVFVRSRRGEGTDLVSLELEAPLVTELTRDRDSETRPRFTPDGKAILFSSDHGGVSNLRRLDLESGQISTLTHTLTGAFNPAQAQADGPIWYMTYTPDGYDLARLDAPAARPLPAAAPADPAPVRTDAAAAPAPAEDYNPWIGLRPRGWLPILAVDDVRAIVGASTAGSDALGIHRYGLSAARDLRNDTWIGGLSYVAWDRLLIGVSRTQDIDLDGDDEIERIRNVDTAWLGVRLPWLRHDHRWTLSSGLVWEREKDDWRERGVAPRRETRDGVAGVALGVDTTRFVADSAGPTAGRRMQVLWETSDVLGRNDYSGEATALDWNEYVDLGRGRVLAAKLNLARADRGTRPYELGGSFNGSALDAALPFNRRDVDLRSYDDGELRGRGYQLVALDWRSPMLTVDRTWTAPPIGLTRVNYTVFAESARVRRTQGWSDWYSGAGAELVGNVVFGYLLPVDVRLGAAWGFQGDAGGRVYLSLGYGF